MSYTIRSSAGGANDPYRPGSHDPGSNESILRVSRGIRTPCSLDTPSAVTAPIQTEPITPEPVSSGSTDALSPECRDALAANRDASVAQVAGLRSAARHEAIAPSTAHLSAAAPNTFRTKFDSPYDLPDFTPFPIA